MLEYVRVAHLQEGYELGETIYNDKLQVLLKAGHKLSKRGIESIKEQGYKGCYIERDTEARIEDIPIPKPLIDDTEKLVVLNMIKETYENEKIFVEPYNADFNIQRKQLDQLCTNIVKEIKTRDASGEFLYEVEDNRTSKNWLYYHVLNTCVISAGIAYEIGLNDTEIKNVAFAGLMHDIGLMKLPKALVDKKDVTEEEKEQIRKHPENGFRLFQRLNYPINVCYGIWQHHEKIDGTGYPKGLKLEKITLAAQIVALASAFDNLVSIQSYNDKPMLQSEALEYIQGCSLYSIDCIVGLLKFIVPYPIGTKVKLSNGEIGIVAKNVAGYAMRPYVLVGRELYNLAFDLHRANIRIIENLQEK